MAKLNRERKVRERRLQKQVKKNARRQAALENPEGTGDTPPGDHLTETSDDD